MSYCIKDNKFEEQIIISNLKTKFKFLNLLTITFIVCVKSYALNLRETIIIKSNDITENYRDSLKNRFNNLQEIKYFTEQIDNTQGLSNSSVNTIFQDSDNLLWIGTWDGLNRYDGSSFKIFRPELNNENSLSNQVILKIDEDDVGNLWVLTMGGINSYNKKEDSFQRYEFSNKNESTLSESEFNMALDNSHQVFCSVKGWGLGYFDGTKFQKIINKNIPELAVKEMTFLNSDKLLILYENNVLYSIEFESRNADEITISNIETISENIKTFKKTTNQQAYLLNDDNDIYKYDGLKNLTSIVDNYKADDIIGKTLNDLILMYNTNYLSLSFKDKFLSKSYFSNFKKYKITNIIQGIENVIWVGTDGDGLIKIYPYRKAFNLVSLDKVPEFEGSIIRSFAEADNGSLFVGTKGKGLFHFQSIFDNKIQNKLNYKIFNEENSKINNAIFSMFKGKNGLIYIGTDGEGLSVFDAENSKLISWKNIINSNLYPAFRSVYAIFQDDNEFIWLGTNGYGMIRLKIKKERNKLYITDYKKYFAGGETGRTLSSNIIFSIIPKNKQELWIGTRLGGLNLFDKGQETFKVFKNDKEDINSLSNNDILSLYNDENEKLWIGTSFGLNVLDSYKNNKAIFKSYTVKDGLPNNTIHGIIGGNNKTLWLSTSFGISNFNVNKHKFVNFSNQEGLQNNEFADGAYYKSRFTNNAFMGGIKGFNYFSLDKINESNTIPSLLINKISGQNQKKPYYQNLVIKPNSKSVPNLVLEHNQNFIDIELAALTYINSEKCKYAYFLKNFDKDWNFINNRRTISFTNIPKGEYSLWVKWTNSDGIWSDEAKAFEVKIKPVYWQSNFAYVLYLFAFLIFLIFVRSYYLKKQSLRQTILSKKRDEEIHQNRLTFFTNIAHELQTPLTLIVGPAQKLYESKYIDEKNVRFVNMIHRNASRLLFLTQQLLDFRKAEYDHLEVSKKQFNLVHLAEQIAELFDEWAIQKNIDYTVEIPPKLKGWFDKDKIEKIVFNLLSNAFKYTPKNGKIHLKFSINNDDKSFLNIYVSNTGKGIPKNKLNSVFDRFFLAENGDNTPSNLYRTGIGLSYVNKIVSVLKGNITVESKENKHTIFDVNIPCSIDGINNNKTNQIYNKVLISDHLQNILEVNSTIPESNTNKVEVIESILDDKKVILIVEDEIEIQNMLVELLTDKYSILIANNGLEALEIMKSNIPDIIVSDIMMPEMDGIELCKRIKRADKTCHIPFIMLTAKNSTLNRIEGLESGANSFIPKPFYPEHLLIRIQKLIEERELIKNHFSKGSIIENLTTLPVENDNKEFIKNLVKIIQTNIEKENLNSLFLERELGVSSSHLYRKIKQLFGYSPGDLIRTIRLKHAAELLEKSKLTVSEICYQSGFNNRSYFYREFKKMYKVTPKNYQIKFKSTPHNI